MLNWIWLGLVLLSVILGGLSGQLEPVTKAAFEACEKAVMGLALPMVGIFALWLGIMRLAEKSGLIEILARALRPLMRFLFPEVPADHPAMGAMVMNMAANMLGLGNASTPLGLRAMQHLERLNPHPGTATNAMCTFLAINTSSIQLIPATAVAILAAAGAANPTSIIGTAFFATLCSTVVGITAVKVLQNLPFFAAPPASASLPASGPEAPEEPAAAPLAPLSLPRKLLLAAFAGFFAVMAWRFAMQPAEAARGGLIASVNAISYLAIPFMLAFFPLYAALRKVPVYEEFVEGAKEGFQVAIRIIPYLVAILVAVGMFRAAGGIQMLTSFLKPVFAPIGFPAELLPLVLMRPLSGSGANGIFAELVSANGADSLLAKMGASIMGSTETTFYVLAVYFGSVAIRRTRHAVAAGLLADIAGVAASVAICNLVFR